MKTFLQWAEENKKELPMDENMRRVIGHWQLPSAAGRANYPDAYFMPAAADAMHKMGYAKKAGGVKPNDVAPSSNAP